MIQKIGNGENIENGVKLNFIIDCIFLKNVDPLFIIAFHLQNFNGLIHHHYHNDDVVIILDGHKHKDYVYEK